MPTGLDGKPTFIVRDSGDDGNGHRERGRVIMVSNRGPMQHTYDRDGRLRRQRNGGGVATALDSVTADATITWIAGAGSDADCALAREGHAIDLDDGRRLRLVAPSADAYRLFYGTFCNPILWFVQHGLWDRLQHRDLEREASHAWEQGYLPVNQAFAEAVVEEIDRDPGRGRVMLHDYHFYVAPLFIRNLRPGAVLQQFVHIPWPGPEAWQELPRSIVQSICRGLLSNDSVVFQTRGSAENFILTTQAYLPDVVLDESEPNLTHAGRRTRVWFNPVSVDIWDLRSRLASYDAQRHWAKLDAMTGERTIIRVDRLDPSKNVAAGFRAYGRLLEQHPEWRGRVRFLAFLVPSRTGIPEYQAYEHEVFAEIDAVNERFGTSDWRPISVFHEHNRPQALMAMSLYDVLLVNPVIDGMNLVSKEGPVLNEQNGVLVLSETAGAFAELREGALSVRPHDIDGTAEALHRALTMPDDERRERARRLREVVLRHDLERWLRLLLTDLERAPRERAAPPRAGSPSPPL